MYIHEKPMANSFWCFFFKVNLASLFSFPLYSWDKYAFDLSKYTEKKGKKIQKEAVAKSYMRKGFFPNISSLGRYVFGSEISYNKAPPRLPGLAC